MKANSDKRQGGQLMYNEYQLEIVANNDYTINDDNKVRLLIKILYQLIPAEKSDTINFSVAAIITFTGMALLLFLLSRKGGSSSEERKKYRNQLIYKFQDASMHHFRQDVNHNSDNVR